MEDFDTVEDIAKQYGWHRLPIKDPYSRSFMKNSIRINYWPRRGVVGTYLKHPKQGKTQLFRRYVFGDELEKIFKNPRLHSGKGYRRRDEL